MSGISSNSQPNSHSTGMGHGTLKYRAEIDGLRALAVIPVILFHAGFGLFSGGYIGVDVFFVISGYLITSIILGEKHAGSFSFKDFYARRARRILPALFFVMIASSIPAWLWMTPAQLKSFSQGVVAISLFASNILFYKTSGYFDSSSEENPLLHTWSLGVEEQYYAMFPIFVIMLWPFGQRRLAWIIGLLAIASIALSEYGWRYHPMANFYLAPTRAWELLIGSLLAFASFNMPLYHRVGHWQNQILSGTGLLLVTSSIFICGKTTPFPSVYALAPTVGSALIIGFASKDTLAAKLLSLRWIVGIGLVSYSAYLWHQPLFAFARIYSINQPSPYIFFALSLAAIFLAYLTWRFIEKPFRDKNMYANKLFFYSGVSFPAAFIAFGLAGHFEDGWKSRFSAQQQELLDYKYDYAGEYQLKSCFLDADQDWQSFANCADSNSSKKPSLFLWGDSHAAHLYPGLKKVFSGDFNLTHLTASGCPPILDMDRGFRPHCKDINNYIIKRIEIEKPNRVMLAAVWGKYDWSAIANTISRLRAAGVKRIEIIGPVPQWIGGLPLVLSRFSQLPERTNRGLNQDIGAVDDNLRLFSAKNNVNYISPKSILCNEDGCLTKLGDNLNSLVAWDYGHLTSAGSEYLVSQFPR